MSSFRVLTVMTPDKRHLRAGVWSLPDGKPRRGICVLLNGMSEFLEKYNEVAEELGARGFVVASLDWRSQGASERTRAGNRASHVASFEEYDADLAALLLQAVEPLQRSSPSPVIALGHSMGGHILLRFLHEHPRRFACAILNAPMLGIDTGAYSPRMTAAITIAFNLRRPSTRFVFGVEKRDPLDLSFEENVLTSDRTRFELAKDILKTQPFLRVHGPTFGWLRAALRSLKRIHGRGFPESIATPVMIIGAGKDRVVKTEATRDYVKRLKNARYVEIAGAEHEILMESDAIRSQFWSAFDGFVNEHVKPV